MTAKKFVVVHSFGTRTSNSSMAAMAVMTPPLLYESCVEELHPDRQASKIPLSTRD